jgi:hypothetical protein
MLFRCERAIRHGHLAENQTLASERHVQRCNMCTALATQLHGAKHELQCDLLKRKVLANTSILRFLQFNCRSGNLQPAEFEDHIFKCYELPGNL